MKKNLILTLALCLPGMALHAQTQGGTAPNAAPMAAPDRGTPATTNYQQDRVNERYGDWNDFGPRAGAWEFTLGGSGLSNKDMDSSAGGVAASVGLYLNDTLLLAVRQNVNYINSSGADSSFISSTRIALDQHILASGRLRPFVGVNFGGVYGEDVTNTFVAGIEAGVKFYVQERTFLYGIADYAWAFRDSDAATDNFNDGGFQWFFTESCG